MKFATFVFLALAVCVDGCATTGKKSTPSTRLATDIFSDTQSPGTSAVWPGNPSQITEAANRTTEVWGLGRRDNSFDFLGGRWSADTSTGNLNIDVERIDDAHSRVELSGSLKPETREFFAKRILHELERENLARNARPIWPVTMAELDSALTELCGHVNLTVLGGRFEIPHPTDADFSAPVLWLERVDDDHTRVWMTGGDEKGRNKDFLKSIRDKIDDYRAADKHETK